MVGHILYRRGEGRCSQSKLHDNHTRQCNNNNCDLDIIFIAINYSVQVYNIATTFLSVDPVSIRKINDNIV